MGDTGSALASARVDSFTISSSPRKRRRPNASQNGVGNNAVVDAFGDDSDSDEGTTAGTYVFGQFLSLEDAKAKSKRLEQVWCQNVAKLTTYLNTFCFDCTHCCSFNKGHYSHHFCIPGRSCSCRVGEISKRNWALESRLGALTTDVHLHV